MRLATLLTPLLALALFGSGAVLAGSDLNELGALLVYPAVIDAMVLRPRDEDLLKNPAAFGRLLYQSVTTGDAVTLILEKEGSTAGGMC